MGNLTIKKVIEPFNMGMYGDFLHFFTIKNGEFNSDILSQQLSETLRITHFERKAVFHPLPWQGLCYLRELDPVMAVGRYILVNGTT